MAKSTATSKGKKDASVNLRKESTTAHTEEVNGQLINPTGIGQNVDQSTPPKTSGKRTGGKSETGDKNKKTTEGKIEGKEKALNRKKSDLQPKDSDPDESDPKSNQDEPKAEKKTRPANDNKDKGKDKPKKKSGEAKDTDN